MIKTESDFRLQLPFSIISMHLHFCPSSGPGPNLLLKSGRDMTGHVTSAASQQWVDILLRLKYAPDGAACQSKLSRSLRDAIPALRSGQRTAATSGTCSLSHKQLAGY